MNVQSGLLGTVHLIKARLFVEDVMTNPRSHNALKAIAAAALTASALGCDGNRINLSREGVVKFTVADCHPVIISAVAEQDGDEMIISGTISRSPPLDPGNLHMDVTVTMPGGEVISAGTALAYPRSIRYRGNRERRFAIWFPFVPPRGSLVHLGCDSQSHPPGDFPTATSKPTG